MVLRAGRGASPRSPGAGRRRGRRRSAPRRWAHWPTGGETTRLARISVRNSAWSERAGARRYTRPSSFTTPASAPIGTRAPRTRAPRSRSAGSAGACPRRARSRARSRAGSGPGVLGELGDAIDVAHEILGAPGEEREIGEPQRDELQSEIEHRGLDPAPDAPDPIGPLGLDALALLARVQLDLGGRSPFELGARARRRAPGRPPAAPPTAAARRRSPATAARAKRSAAARSAAPSSSASSRARSASPSESRAHAIAVSRPTPSASISRATSAVGGASKRTSWQRERIVGSTSISRSVSRIRCTNEAGSSSVFSIRFAASSPSSSTRSITNTRRDDSNGVLLAAEITGSAMSLTRISWAPLGRHPGQVGMGAGQRPARARCPDRPSRRRAAPTRPPVRPRACRLRRARGTGTRATGGRPAPAPARARRARVDVVRAAVEHASRC